MSDLVTGLKERLDDGDAEIRRRAVLDLKPLGPRDATPLLVVALGDEDWRVRKEAAHLASHFADHKPLVAALIRAVFEEENIGLKNAAQEALSRAGGKIESEVAEVLASNDPESRKVAVDIIGALKSSRATALLSSALEDENLNVRIAAAEQLGLQEDKGAKTALLACLKDPHPLLRMSALQSLRHLDVSIPFGDLTPLLRDPVLLEEVLLALGRCGSAEAVPLLVRYLEDEPSACLALEALHDSGTDTARAVAEAMAERTPEIRGALIAMTRHSDPDISRAAVRLVLFAADIQDISEIVTLARNSPLYSLLVDGLSAWGEKTPQALLPLLSEETEHRLASVIGLLTRLLDEETGTKTAPLFAAHLLSPHPAVTTAAAFALARFGDENVVPELLGLLNAEDPRSRGAAGLALAEIAKRRPSKVRGAVAEVPLSGEAGIELCRVLEVAGTDADLESLAQAVDSSDPALRRAALKAFAQVGGEKALPRIAALLKDDNLGIRMAAADALAVVGAPARDIIVNTLDKAEGPTAASLLRALGKVGHPDAEATLTKMCRKSADLIPCALEAATALGISLTGVRHELLHYKDEEVLKAALLAFDQRIPASELIELLAHESWDIRLRAVHALASRLDDEGVRESLEQRLDVEDDDLVKAALEAAAQADRRSKR